jgi:hypothetical protein
MPRTRRIALLVALAVVGALGLTACGREQPGTAAYVGDVRFTDRQLDTMVAEVKEHHPSEAANIRTVALSWLIMTNLARQVAQERGISALGPDYLGNADQLEMPASASFVRAAADYEAALGSLTSRLTPVPATPDNLRRYFDDMAKIGVPLAANFESWAAEAASVSAMPLALAIMGAIRETTRHTRVVVNPRYLPLQLNVGPLPVVLGFAGSDVVRSSPAAHPSTDPDSEEDPNAPAN